MDVSWIGVGWMGVGLMEFFEQQASAPNLEMLISHGAELSAKI